MVTCAPLLTGNRLRRPTRRPLHPLLSLTVVCEIYTRNYCPGVSRTILTNRSVCRRLIHFEMVALGDNGGRVLALSDNRGYKLPTSGLWLLVFGCLSYSGVSRFLFRVVSRVALSVTRSVLCHASCHTWCHMSRVLSQTLSE